MKNAVIVPPLVSSMIQPAGVMDADGNYVAHGALWRKHRPITTMPEMPAEIKRERKGRWLWGGVLWVHFGHFLVESSSRLWALDQLKDELDGVIFVPKRPNKGTRLYPYHKDFIHLMAPGIDIRIAAQPNRIEELVVPGQGFGIGRITRGTTAFKTAFRNSFGKHVKPEGKKKLYISRSALGFRKGGLLGEEKLEEYLRAEGYDIFHPEQHAMSEQVARYKAADQVIGADGSALHLFSMVGRSDQKVAIISRRKSRAQQYLVENVEHFCGSAPLNIQHLKREWVRVIGDKTAPSRSSHGEMDLPKIGSVLEENGFIASSRTWENLSDAELQAMFQDKDNPEGATFKPVEKEDPAERARIKEMRTARRAASQGSKVA
ncbi:MAG: DUF563 domain-containing protein [Arenibacterium sp.]